MTTKILTSFMTRQVAEGQMVSYTYSVADESGNFIQRNTKASFLLTDPATIEHIKAVENYIVNHKLSE